MLNKNQRDVVFSENVKPLLVEAGPGSGKTFVIVERIKFLLEKADPESFLVITFSRKAAKQLRDKLYCELPREIVDKMQISTIHSFCLEFLKDNGVTVTLIDDDNSEKKELFLKKHRKTLGFVDEFTIRNFSPVMSKFNEYTIYNVDTPKLVDYLRENKTYSDEYVELVHSMDWFKKKVVKKDHNDDWYNAKYQQVAAAYPIYKDLLDDYSYVDFDIVQMKVLELLNTDHMNKYKNVLVDEFQDTDPIQARIFKKLIGESDTFMGVGDIDQRIYFFRGAYGDYFDEFSREFNVDVYPLNVNHRSTNEIIEVSEAYIKDYRGDYSHKELEPYRNVHNNSYILNNGTAEEEASNIYKFINYLMDNQIVESYDDIAVLTRTVTFSDTVPLLIGHLKDNGIPVNSADFSDLKEQNEVKSIITLLYYITRKVDDNYMHKVEKEWGGLKAFNGEAFEPTMWSLSQSTKDYLSKLEEDFTEIATNCEKGLIKELGIRGRKSKNLVRIFENRDENLIELLFQRVKRPLVELDKITNENDRQFFSRLHEIRDSLYAEERPTILDVYYSLLELGGYFREDIINDEQYSPTLRNLAVLTKTIENYENSFSKHYVKGLLSFLTRKVESYSSSDVHEEGINIMTVHKAKGLEFPVTIVASLQKDKFPPIAKDPNRENKTDMYDETFYTPNDCLRYKSTTEEEDNELEELEGVRLAYVAMTRAQDILLLSTIGEVPNEIEAVAPLLSEFNPDTANNIKIEKSDDETNEEKLSLSYSSYDTYENCPLKYKMVYDFEFKTSSSDPADMGSIVHKSLEAINNKLKNDEEITEDEAINIIEKIYSSKYEITGEDDEDFEEFCDTILDYLDEFLDNGYKVIDCEVPFSIEFDDFILEGAIDLIYQDGDTIKILDYKNTEYRQSNIPKYKSQLLTYMLALENDPYYKKYNIDTKHASIYLLQSNKPLELIIDEDIELTDKIKEMNDAAISINNNIFDSKKSDYCNICEFKDYCECGKNG